LSRSRRLESTHGRFPPRPVENTGAGSQLGNRKKRIKATALKQAKKSIWLIGFRSAASPESYGNIWFEQDLGIVGNDEAIQTPPRFYAQSDLRPALADLLSALDTNNDRVIEAADLENIALVVSGYGWGGATAVHFTQTINTVGQIIVGGNPRNPLTYTLAVPIPVFLLLTYDVNPFLNPPGTVQNNVSVLWNFFQRRGGDTTFMPVDGGHLPVTVGTPLSRLVRDIRLESHASDVSLQIDSSQLRAAKTGSPFGLPAGQYQLTASHCGHDGVTFLPDLANAIASLMRTGACVDPVALLNSKPS